MGPPAVCVVFEVPDEDEAQPDEIKAQIEEVQMVNTIQFDIKSQESQVRYRRLSEDCGH
jgi:hypothetical protein